MAKVQRRLIVASLFLLAGCSSTQACGRDPLPPRFYDPELLPFLDQFMEEAFSHGVATILDPELRIMKYVPIDFTDGDTKLDSKMLTIGICAAFDANTEEDVLPGSYPHLISRREGAWQEMWILDKGEGLYHGWDYWDLRILIYHELGHCLLGLGHIQGTIMDPTPVGVVKRGLYPGEEMSVLWKRTVDQLMELAKEKGL